MFKFWTLKTVKRYLSLCLIAAMCINIIMCTFDSANVLAEDNFMASIASAADKDNKISVIFSSEPENTADWSQIKVLDSYGNDVFNGSCESSLKTLNVNLSEELNSQMEYALILPRTLCNVNGTLIKNSVLYFGLACRLVLNFERHFRLNFRLNSRFHRLTHFGLNFLPHLSFVRLFGFHRLAYLLCQT